MPEKSKIFKEIKSKSSGEWYKETELISKFKSKDLPLVKIKSILNELKREGEIYCPKMGYLKATR